MFMNIAGNGVVSGASTVFGSIVQTLNTAILPDVTVRDVKLNTTTGVLSVATFGRGTWQYAIRPYISGFVFEDLNGNGVRDPGEGPLAGINVIAIDNNAAGGPTPFANIDSRADGFYAFRSLPNSSYTIVLGNPAAFHHATQSPPAYH